MVNASVSIVRLLILLVIAVSPITAVAEKTISGVVTGDGGRPVRGATITATSGNKSISRYSKDDGEYTIAVSPGTYDVVVHAFGFGIAWQSIDTAKSSKIDFPLTPRLDVAGLTPAEIDGFLPDTAETRLLRRTCMACHGLETVARLRGFTASDWEAFLPAMTRATHQYAQPDFGTTRLAVLSTTLEKYFGPLAPYFGPDSAPPKAEQVKHAIISDAALGATITEYKLPTPFALPNGVIVDARDRPWWNEINTNNEVGQFDPVTEQFHMHTLEIENSMTGVVGKDGSIWIPLDPGPISKTYIANRENTARKGLENGLARVDPDTNKVTYYKSNDPSWHGFGPRTLALSPQGNIWTASHYPAYFDVEKGTFKVYELPVSQNFPEGTLGTWTDFPGLPRASTNSDFNSYNSVAVDSKGIVYLSKYYEGTIVRLDPATGVTKGYRAPGMVSAHGVIVDNDDNVWVCDTFGDTLVRLDPKTGIMKQYPLPTANAQPFGASYDKRTGYIYFGEDSGNNITTFDPKTERFVEYPLPTPESYPRFVATDSKGRIWYGAGGVYAGKIGVIDPGKNQ